MGVKRAYWLLSLRCYVQNEAAASLNVGIIHWNLSRPLCESAESELTLFSLIRNGQRGQRREGSRSSEDPAEAADTDGSRAEGMLIRGAHTALCVQTFETEMQVKSTLHTVYGVFFQPGYWSAGWISTVNHRIKTCVEFLATEGRAQPMQWARVYSLPRSLHISSLDSWITLVRCEVSRGEWVFVRTSNTPFLLSSWSLVLLRERPPLGYC